MSEALEKTDMLEAFFKSIKGASRVQVHAPNALGDVDTSNFPGPELADRLAALQAENDNLKAALDAQEQDAGLADGNLWRFWSRKARKMASENERLREALARIAWNDEPNFDHLVARAALKGDTP